MLLICLCTGADAARHVTECAVLCVQSDLAISVSIAATAVSEYMRVRVHVCVSVHVTCVWKLLQRLLAVVASHTIAMAAAAILTVKYVCISVCLCMFVCMCFASAQHLLMEAQYWPRRVLMSP
jgi:hypothetical protein